jgi:hypothetical protein
MRCENCGKALAGDPNDAADVVACRYCGDLVCSEQCATEHEERRHPGEAAPLPDEDEERAS